MFNRQRKWTERQRQRQSKARGKNRDRDRDRNRYRDRNRDRISFTKSLGYTDRIRGGIRLYLTGKEKEEIDAETETEKEYLLLNHLDTLIGSGGTLGFV